MGLLLKLLFGSGQKKVPKNKEAHFEQEMDQYGLLDDEKKLVQSGEYDPWNFEEEETDEDDYYHDDS